MLYSLAKILLLILIVVLLASGLAYLLDAKDIFLGEVQATISGTEYTLSPLQAVLFLVALTVLIWIVLKLLSFTFSLLRFINGDDTALSRFFSKNREKKGYRALADGMLALASGEGRVAMDKANKAAKFLDNPSLTNILAAQAAELSGDRAKAEEIYKSLVLIPEAKFVGVRGLLKQKLEDGNTEVALKLAEKAFSIKPKHEEIQDTLLQLQAKSEDWSGARQTLRSKLKHGSLPRDVHKRRDAVLALSQAKGVIGEELSIEAREKAIEANRLSPDLVPAATMAARSYIEAGKPRYATRVVQAAWKTQPHPDLATAYAEIVPQETPEQRLKRFAQLRKLAPEHRETKLAMAELFLATEEFGKARKDIEDMLEDDPDARVLTIMAAAERGEGGSDDAVRAWLTKALGAKRGPQWICEKCQTAHSEWRPVCANCEAFDTLAWKSPPVAGYASSTGLEMLPLIVGAGETFEDEKEDKTASTAPVIADAEVTQEVTPKEIETSSDAGVSSTADGGAATS